MRSSQALMGVSLRGGKDMVQVSAHATADDLRVLSELIEAGKVRPEIDRRYPFERDPRGDRLPGTGAREREGGRGGGLNGSGAERTITLTTRKP